jgi:cellular nucleic acid-binding protein
MVYIYVLKLQHDKYYVGKTSNPYFRIESHFNSEGSEWTKIHNPVKLLELIKGDDYDEDKYTKIYMDTYGIDNVRGGSYTSVKLDKETKNQLVKISNSTNNRCFKCEKVGHFANDCKEEDNDSSSNSEENVILCCEYCDKEFEDEEKCEYHERYCKKKNKQISGNSCFKCGRYGHFANNCWFKKSSFSKSTSSKKCDICGKYGHYEINCYQF